MVGAALGRRLLLGSMALLMLAVPAQPQVRTRTVPRLDPVAETRLLMQGINLPNFRGLERLLNQKAPDAQVWTFARGQALLIAEGGNLLMLRPPKNQGQQAWFERAMELQLG